MVCGCWASKAFSHGNMRVGINESRSCEKSVAAEGRAVTKACCEQEQSVFQELRAAWQGHGRRGEADGGVVFGKLGRETLNIRPRSILGSILGGQWVPMKV